MSDLVTLAMIKQYERGLTLKQVGAIHGVSEAMVVTRLKRNDVARRKRGAPIAGPLGDEKYAERNLEIIHRRAQGEALSKIARSYDVSAEFIRQVVKRYDVRMGENVTMHALEVARENRYEVRTCPTCGINFKIARVRTNRYCSIRCVKSIWSRERVIEALTLRAAGKSWRQIGEYFSYSPRQPASCCMRIKSVAERFGIDAAWAFVGKGAGGGGRGRANLKALNPPPEWRERAAA